MKFFLRDFLLCGTYLSRKKTSLHRQNVDTRIKFGAHQCFSAFTSNVLRERI